MSKSADGLMPAAGAVCVHTSSMDESAGALPGPLSTPTDEPSASPTTERAGYAIVIAGAVAFVVSTFLPFTAISPGFGGPESLSLFGHLVSPGFPGSGGLISVVEAVYLYCGVIIILLLAFLGIRGRGDLRVALAAVVALWTVQWGSSLVIYHEVTVMPAQKLAFGYWCLAGSVAVVVGGAIFVWVKGRRAPQPV